MLSHWEPRTVTADERAYQTALAYLEQDLEGFIGAAFADVGTATIQVSHCVLPAFALGRWVTAAGEMLRSQLHAMEALRASAPEEIVVTLDDQIHIVRRVLPDVFLFMAVTRETSNLALLKMAIRARTAHIQE